MPDSFIPVALQATFIAGMTKLYPT